MGPRADTGAASRCGGDTEDGDDGDDVDTAAAEAVDDGDGEDEADNAGDEYAYAYAADKCC